MRSVPFGLQCGVEQCQVLGLPALDLLRRQVGALVDEERAGELEPVGGEEPASEEPVDRPVEVKCVAGDEPADLVSEGIRVPQASEDPAA